MDHRRCLACGDTGLLELDGFEGLRRVTSDAKLFASGGRLAICGECSLIQKYCDEKWLGEIANIYGSYSTFALEGISDQLIFDQTAGRMRPRCKVILENLASHIDFSQTEHLLDFGCGRGAMLKAASRIGCNTYGYDLDTSHVPYLEPLPNFVELFTNRDDLPIERFDVVTMIHSLEHFTDPLSEVRLAFSLLKEGGYIFIQVNDTRKNPFEIFVADHLTHFEPATASRLVEDAGFSVLFSDNSFVGKEICLLAQKPAKDSLSPGRINLPVTHDLSSIRQQIAWLDKLANKANDLAKKPGFGLFGSSIAATWLFGQVEDGVEFFVDEDISRVGGRHLGRQIRSPDDLGPDQTILIGLIPTIAAQIKSRLQNLETNFEVPD